MKKNLVICMNCHGGPIQRIFRHRYKNTLCDDYNIFHINYAPHASNLLKTKKFLPKHIELIKSADLLIVQFIENDRGELNHEYIIENLSKTDKIIIIPHYRFSGYFYNEEKLNKLLENCYNTNVIKKELQTYVFDEKECINFLNNELEFIKELDKKSSINMYEYVKNNYKKYKLFNDRGHPSFSFFTEFVNQIIEQINLLVKTNYEIIVEKHIEEIYPDNNHKDIIFNQTKEILNLQFDNKVYLSKQPISISHYILLQNSFRKRINNFKKKVDEK